MLISDIIKKIKYDLGADRIGPDIPFTHWKLFYQNQMLRLCKNKFRKFSDSAQFRPGAYAVGCSKIEIGHRVVIRPNCMLFADTNYPVDVTICIEDDVMLGSGVHIYINNHSFNRLDIPIIDQGHEPPKPVILRKGCWIGANVILLPGVEIGENSIIGAGSIVTKSIPKRVLAVGNPAKVIRQIKQVS
jgi:acetyltransferase-like isoleucine patch superfamily enzyme